MLHIVVKLNSKLCVSSCFQIFLLCNNNKFEIISVLCPNVSRYYGNRAACYMMLGQYRDALADAKKCIELEPKFSKV